LGVHTKLKASFYQQEDVVEISRFLLGKYLVTQIGSELTSGMIVETEAYEGAIDRASHAYNYRRTPRTEVMYTRGGVLYVYMCYGLHYLTNVVTNTSGVPHAVLIRAIQPDEGLDIILARLNKQSQKRCTAGPALVSKAMGIDKQMNKLSLSGNTVYIEDRGIKINKSKIVSTTRIGVDYAGVHANWKYRFYVAGNAFVSRY
jgi:DNA-3-methyladenine glycosylase